MAEHPLIVPVPFVDFINATVIQEKYLKFIPITYAKLGAEMAQMNVILDEDPETAGLSALNVKIAHIDALKTRAAVILNFAISNESKIDLLNKQMQALYKREFDMRIITIPVTLFSSKELREAACNTLLGELKELQSAIEGTVFLAKVFTRKANNTLAQLDSSNKNISRQITVIQTQIEIGEIQRTSAPDKHIIGGTLA